MTVIELLSQRKGDILARWFDMVIETYPSDTATFLRRQKNEFTNPVGHTIMAGIEGILDALIQHGDPELLSPFLDNIVRIRAVQDFSPSRAISFIFCLKGAVREQLKNESVELRASEELLAFESKIDALALLTFDIYMKCREKIYDLKANETRRMTFRLIERLNRMGEKESQESENEERHSDTIKRDEVSQ